MRYALVTGGSRGIGRAICIQLARDGYSVIVNYKSNHEAAQETKRLIESEGGRAELLPFDVANPEAINAALDTWEQKHKHKNEYIEVLVNNAGVTKDSLFLDMEPSAWHRVIDTTLNGFYYVTRRLLQEMMINHLGRIINMSSMAGIKGVKGQVNHAAAKAALIGVTKALAVEVASRKITVNAIAPRAIETDVTREYAETNYQTLNDIIADIRKSIPVQRAGKPEEVADLVSFLVSNKAAYITGQVIAIDGGWGV